MADEEDGTFSGPKDTIITLKYSGSRLTSLSGNTETQSINVILTVIVTLTNHGSGFIGVD